MNKLIKLQLRNLFHNKLIYVILALNLVLGPILTYLTTIFSAKAKMPKVLPQIQTDLSSEIGLLCGIFIIIFCCYDFSEGTTKNIIARGYTRIQLLFSKYIVSLIGLLVVYAATILLSIILFASSGIGYHGDMPLIFTCIVFNIITLTIVYVTMTFILEKSSTAIIVYLFVPSVIQFVLTLIDSQLHVDASRYWVDNVMNAFMDKPTIENLGLSIVIYLAYSIVFIVGGSKIINKKEIK